MPKALLVYPEFPASYWSAKYALEFVNRKAAMPPLGLLTVAALFPASYELRVIDMNVSQLSEEDLLWADYVFLSAMIVQRTSFHDVARRARALGRKVIAGGPYPTSFQDEINDVDYLVTGEVEDYFESFLQDLEAGRAAPVSAPPSAVKPDVSTSPIPRFDLIDIQAYGSMAIQFSRGCPFDCEFCDITKLYGRRPRTKSSEQIVAELNVLYNLGWRGELFFVDDNFIGNKQSVRKLLPPLIAWQKEHRHPFCFYTEASINLAKSDDLMKGMAEAGFDMVFLGLETPNPQTLKQINKGQNVEEGNPEYLLQAVRKIQSAGMKVTAGFILGLDGEGPEAVQNQIDFIQKAGIPTAMVGLLSALKGTRLYERLKSEGRLVAESTGDNVSLSVNYIPEMGREELIAGYKRLLATIYDRSLSNYFERCSMLLRHWRLPAHQGKPTKNDYIALWRSITRQVFSRQGPAYLKFLARTIFTKPHFVPEAIRLAILGYHFEKVTRQQILVEEFRSFLDAERQRLQRLINAAAASAPRLPRVHEVTVNLQRCFAGITARYDAIHHDFRAAAEEALTHFQESVQQQLEHIKHLISEPMRLKRFGGNISIK